MSLRSALLDALVPASFGRPGFSSRSTRFDARDLEVDLTGVSVGITGGTNGIGLATAAALKALGASVTMLARDARRGEEALASLAQIPAGEARFLSCDVGDRASVDAAARALGPKPFDRFVHNASILPHERRLTREELEATYATNLVGPLRLEHLLDPGRERLRRVVWVSSGGMYLVPLDLRELRGDVRRFDGVRAYAQTKRAQILVARAASRRLGPAYAAYAMHPGWVDTTSVVEALPTFHRVTRGILRTHEQGADTAVWLTATARELTPGAFYFDREARDFELFPGTHTEAALEAELLVTLARDADIPPLR